MSEVDAPWIAAAFNLSKISVSCFFEPNKFGTSCFCGGFARPSLTGGRSANLSSMRRWAAGAHLASVAFSFSGSLQAEASSSSEELSIFYAGGGRERGASATAVLCARHTGVCKGCHSQHTRRRATRSSDFKIGTPDSPGAAYCRCARCRCDLAYRNTLAFLRIQLWGQLCRPRLLSSYPHTPEIFSSYIKTRP